MTSPTPDGVFARDGRLSIRRLRDERADLELLARWRAEPHVHAWWDPDDPPPTTDEAAEHYGDRAGDGPTMGCILQRDGEPVGYLQCYRWSSWPEEAAEIGVDHDDRTWGLDVFVGEPAALGQGVGTRAVDLACRWLFEEHAATAVSLTTELTNLRAQRAYEKAGFRKVRQVLDTDTRGGERVLCWLMTRTAG